jgi:hypothetical protein
MPIHIPQDIIEEIVDKLHDYRQALSTCALISQSFRPPSQSHLYSSLSIHLGFSFQSPHRHEQLLNIFSMNPLLGTYVRELRVTTIPGDHVEETTFSAILHMLPSVRQLNMGSKKYTDLHWDALTSNMKNVLLQFLRTPTLVDVSLDGIKLFPMSFITHCPQLQKLRLSNIDFDDDITDNSTPPFPGPVIDQGRLKSLEVWSDTSYFPTMFMKHISRPFSALSLSYLRTLDIGLLNSNEDTEECQNLMSGTEGLESLLINVCPSNFFSVCVYCIR